MPLFYSSPAEGVAFLEAVDDAWYARAVYAAAVKRGQDETPPDGDDGTT